MLIKIQFFCLVTFKIYFFWRRRRRSSNYWQYSFQGRVWGCRGVWGGAPCDGGVNSFRPLALSGLLGRGAGLVSCVQSRESKDNQWHFSYTSVKCHFSGTLLVVWVLDMIAIWGHFCSSEGVNVYHKKL